MQNLPSELESAATEQFKLLLQVQICHKQLEEFALYFHVPVRQLECLSVKTRTENRTGISREQHSVVHSNYHPNKTKLVGK